MERKTATIVASLVEGARSARSMEAVLAQACDRLLHCGVYDVHQALAARALGMSVLGG